MTKAKFKFICLSVLLLSLPVVSRAQFTFTTNADNTITITEYAGSDSSVTIPDTINGLPVTGIGKTVDDGFGGSIDMTVFFSSSITNIAISAGVTNINISAFDCAGLMSFQVNTNNLFFADIDGVLFNWEHTLLVRYPQGRGDDYIIPNTVNKIGGNAFNGCANLRHVTIPNGIAGIGNAAFFHSGLTNAVIPVGVNNIEDQTFAYCYGLTGVTIPNGVTNIGLAAFMDCSSLTNITIPDTVSCIRGGAFGDCTGLRSVVIPSGVTCISNGVFADCTGLTNVTIPDSVTYIGHGAFGNCLGLTSVVVPDGVTNIEENTFYNCRNLASVTLPKDLRSIGYFAFAFCSLTNIVIPSGVTNIGDGVFYSTKLGTVFFEGDAPLYLGADIFDNTSNLVVYHVPSAAGWGETFAGYPTTLWFPQMQSSGVQTNLFGFSINWARGQTVVVEISTNLIAWQPAQTNTLTINPTSFSDSQWINYPNRFYRLRAP